MSIHPALIALFMAQAPRDFDLDFRNGIYRRNGLIIPSLMGVGGFSHTQSGSCWEVTPDGSLVAFAANEPRVVPGLGLWARGSFTNLLTRSQQLNTAPWSGLAGSTVTANDALAPDGTVSGERYNAAAATFGGILRSNVTAIAANQYTLSVIAKKINHRYLGFRIGGSSIGGLEKFPTYDFDTHALASQGIAGVTQGALALSSSWVRPWLTYTTATNGSVDLALTKSDGTTFTPPAGTEQVHLWQAQLVNGLQPGPLILTTSAAASNGASVTAIPFTQKDEDFVMLVGFNLVEGSTGAIRSIAQLRLDSDNRWLLRLSSTGIITALARTAAVSVAFGNSATAVTNDRAVVAMRYRAGKLSLAYKIGAATTAIGAEVATAFPSTPFSELNIGSETGSLPLNGIVERWRLIPGTFDDAALANLITNIAA